MLVLTTGGLCLLAPRWLLVAVPAAALNLLSAYDLQHTIQYHYWIVAAGAVAVAGRSERAVCRPRAPGRGSPGRPRPDACSCFSRSSGSARSDGRSGRVAAPGRPAGGPRCDPRRCARRRPDARAAAPRRARAHLRRPGAAPRGRVGTEWGDAERERATEQLDYIVFDPGMRFWGAPSVEQVEQEIERRGFVEVMRRGDTRLYGREAG